MEFFKKAIYCTKQTIEKALLNEYEDSITSKIERWINVTHVTYFQNKNIVKFYFQAKMLFRDGFYDAAIMATRSMCEMLCYDLISKLNHPFGNDEDIESTNFRTLVRYIAVPKRIDKQTFEESLIGKIKSDEDISIVSNLYSLSNSESVYLLKNENGKKSNILKSIFSIFDNIEYKNFDCISYDHFHKINHVYDIGINYVHPKSHSRNPEEDAYELLNIVGEIIFFFYGIKNSPEGLRIKSGYTDFPDICNGMSFAIDCYNSIEGAMRGYYNIPSEKYTRKMLNTEGKWSGEWFDTHLKKHIGEILLYKECDYLKAKMLNHNDKQQNVGYDIRLFGNYFHLISFTKDEDQISNDFELSFFSDDLLVGKHLGHKQYAIFRRT